MDNFSLLYFTIYSSYVVALIIRAIALNRFSIYPFIHIAIAVFITVVTIKFHSNTLIAMADNIYSIAFLFVILIIGVPVFLRAIKIYSYEKIIAFLFY